MNTSNLVIGMGAVGKALYSILKEFYPTQKLDLQETTIQLPIDVIHICFPYKVDFEEEVMEYIKKFKPKFVVIHSTVKVGTTRNIANASKTRVLHSPVIGQHDSLRIGLLTFDKWVGGLTYSASLRIKKLLQTTGIKCKIKSSPEVCELAKLFSTYRYAISIARAQEEAKICKQIGVDFKEVSQDFIKMYNKGYEKLGMDWVKMPNTYPGVIEGHCLLPNLEILKTQYPNMIFPKAIIESNNRTKHESH